MTKYKNLNDNPFDFGEEVSPEELERKVSFVGNKRPRHITPVQPLDHTKITKEYRAVGTKEYPIVNFHEKILEEAHTYKPGDVIGDPDYINFINSCFPIENDDGCFYQGHNDQIIILSEEDIELIEEDLSVDIDVTDFWFDFFIFSKRYYIK